MHLSGDTLQSRCITSFPKNSVPLPDLSLLFALHPHETRVCLPLMLPDGVSPEKRTRPGSARYTGCFARFFEQLPARRLANAIRPVPELKWSAARKIALARDLYRCRHCGTADAELLTVHHVFPRGLGGGNEPGNLVTLCESCHQTLCRHCSRPSPARISMGETVAQVREVAGVPAGPD